MSDPLIRNEFVGAGLYGGPAPSHVTRCVNSRNPYGHNRECPCGWAKPEGSQEPDSVPEITPSRFTAWWPGDAA